MLKPISVQQLIDASQDATSLSDFMFKPAEYLVPRRLSPEIHTLNHYLNYFESFKKVLTQPTGNVVVDGITIPTFNQKMVELDSTISSSLTQTTGDILALQASVSGITEDTNLAIGAAIAALPFDSNKKLADTFVTATINADGSIARTQRDKNSERVSAKDFGAVGNKITDDTVAINNYIAYCKTQKPAVFWLPSGDYLVSDTINLDLPNDSKIIFEGALHSTALHKDLLVIGSETINRFNYALSEIKVQRVGGFANISTDTTRTCAAVRLLNLVSATGNIAKATGCWHGVLMDASAANGGSSYNTITLGSLKDNVVCLRLTARAPSGYTNENTFIGGSMGHSSAFPYTGEEVDIVVDQTSGVYNLNNNLFLRPSLESNSITSKAANLGGAYNSIYMPRIENSKNYAGFAIEFMAGSSHCSVLGGGFGLKIGNIIDNGSNSSYTTASGTMLSGAAGVGDAVLTLRNSASNTGEAICVLNTSKSRNFSVLGDGTVSSSSTGYFLKGLRWSTTDGTKNDKGIFVSSTAPSGSVSAGVGSLHVNTSNGAISTKVSGATTTGWRDLQTIASGVSTARPTSPTIGQSFFDTTLSKSIWWGGTAWVDAAGATV